MRESLRALAQEKGLHPATLAYAWLLHRGVTAPVAGATKTYQLDEAVADLDVTLTEAEAARLEAAYEPRSVLGHS